MPTAKRLASSAPAIRPRPATITRAAPAQGTIADSPGKRCPGLSSTTL